MIRILLITCLFAWFSPLLSAEKTIYKYTDENGVTHYSETQLNDNYKPADLPPISVVDSVNPTVSQRSAVNNNTSKDIADETQITLTQPTAGENLWGTGGTLTVAVAPLSELQQLKYLIQFVMDDKKSEPGDSNSYAFELVERGSHQVQALLISRGQHKVAGESEKITVFMHQASKK